MDESGTPPKPQAANTARPYFVLAGVIIHEAQWHEISRELTLLRKTARYRVLGEIKWRFFGRDNKDQQNSVSHLDADMKNEFRTKFFEILTKRRSVKIIACATNTRRAYEKNYIKDEEDLYFHTYKPLTERLNTFFRTWEER